MNLLTADERSEFTHSLGYATAVDADGIRRALASFRYADRHRTDTTAVVRAIAGAQAVTKRLLDVEADHGTVRRTVARLVIANQRGDDYSLADLAFELQQAGLDLKTDYDAADDLARATESEAL